MYDIVGMMEHLMRGPTLISKPRVTSKSMVDSAMSNLRIVRNRLSILQAVTIGREPDDVQDIATAADRCEAAIDNLTKAIEHLKAENASEL